MAEAAVADLETLVAAAELRYVERNPESRRLHEERAKVMPGGNTRTIIHVEPFPLTIVRGQGAQLTDADGHEYVDFLGEYTAGLFGHSPHDLEDDDGEDEARDNEPENDVREGHGALLELQGGDDNGAGRVVVDDHDLGADGDLLGPVDGIGVERLGTAPDGDHHFAEPIGPDTAGDPTHLAHHPLICHSCSVVWCVRVAAALCHGLVRRYSGGTAARSN